MPNVPALISLRGAKVIVTGAAGGLGSSLTSALQEMGCDVIGIDRPASVEASADASRMIGADLADADVARVAIGEAVCTLGGLDSLVGAAANVATIHRADRFPTKDFSADIEANLLSQFWTAQAAYPSLVKSKNASIVMVSSTGALDGLPGQAAYAASKAGVLGLVRTLAAEWAAVRVRVNAVVPGLIATPKVVAMPLDIKDRVLATVAQKRLVSLEEVVCGIAYLMSPAARAITGQSLRIDGGAGLNTLGLHH